MTTDDLAADAMRRIVQHINRSAGQHLRALRKRAEQDRVLRTIEQQVGAPRTRPLNQTYTDRRGRTWISTMADL